MSLLRRANSKTITRKITQMEVKITTGWMSQCGGNAGTSSNKRWRSCDQFRGGRTTKECLQWSAGRGGKSWTESICRERRCAGRNVGTNSCTFPNLQAIDWALAKFTRALYLHFSLKKQLDKPVPVPKEHFRDISGGAAQISGIKRHQGLETGRYLHVTFNYRSL